MEYLDGKMLKHVIGNRPMDLETLLSLGIEIPTPSTPPTRRHRPPGYQAGKYFRDPAWARQGS